MRRSTLESPAPLMTREEYVAQILRQAILRTELKPGERLDQARIAKQLKVSRTPVRNALLMLSNEGLVEMSPHLGAVVLEMPPDEIEEIYFVRSILEGIAARLGAERAGEHDLVVLQGLVDALDTADDLDDWLALNRRFHFHIYGLAKRSRLLSLIDSIYDLTLPFSRRYIDTEEQKQTAQRGHLAILSACKQQDGHLAQDATHDHINAVCKGVLETHGTMNIGCQAAAFSTKQTEEV